jgi:hypothetical protein
MGVRQRVERIHFPDDEARDAALAAIEAGADVAVAVQDAGGRREHPDTWLQWSQFGGPLVDAVIELPVGGVAAPSGEGPPFLILRVLERESVALPPLEDVRAQILRGLRVRHQTQRVEALARRLRKEAGVRLYDETIALLARRTAESILAPEDTEFGARWALPRLTAEEADRTVAEWGKEQRWTAGDYVRMLEEQSPQRRPRMSLPAAVRLECVRGVTTLLFVEEAHRRDLEEEWWAARALREARVDWLVQLALEDIEESAEVDASTVDSLATLLRQTQPELFRRASRARVLWFEFPTREAAEAEGKRMRKAGGAPERLRRALEGEDVLLGTYRVLWLTAGGVDEAGLDRVARGEGTGEVAGPFDFGEKWVLVQRLDTEPERTLTSEEILEDVRARIRRSRRTSAIDRWVEARRKELGVNVDEEALDGLAPGA